MNVILQASFGERVLEGGKYAILGFATVLLVLAAIWGILAVFGVVFSGKKRSESKAEPAKVAEAPKPSPSSDDGAVVAAITAAITMLLADEAARENKEPQGFRVVSFKRAGKNRK